MILKKIIVPLLLLFFIQTVSAQKQIVLEKLRCLSVNGPVMNYWKNEETRKTFARQLNKILLKYQQIPLHDSTDLNIEFLANDNGVRPVKPDFRDPDTSNIHLYIDLFEVDPVSFFTNTENYPPDSNLVKRTKCVFIINAWLLKADKTVLFNEMLNIIVSSSETPGMGIEYGNGIRFGNLTVTPKGFTELLKAATNLLFDPKNEIVQVEMKVLPAFLADNYILPKTINRPRTFVKTIKNISSYPIQNKMEMIRMGDAIYEEIRIKGKKAEKYPYDLTMAIQNTNHFSSSDYVFLRQDCRDVLRDENYLVKLTVQLDPGNTHMGDQLMFTNFLPGNFHYLLHEKDTLATFSIQTNVPGKEEKIFANTVSNGFDSSSFFHIEIAQPEWQVTYDYVVTGTISNRHFSIKCSGYRNTVKEIFLNNSLVCIAQGKFSPEKFVLFDASLSPEILNRLFMIGFNRFFE